MVGYQGWYVQKSTRLPEEENHTNIILLTKRFTCPGDGEPVGPGELHTTSTSRPGFLLYKVIMAGYIGSTIQYQMVVDPTPMYGLMSQVIHLPNCSQLPD